MALQASTIQAAQAGQTPEQIASIAQADTVPAKAPAAPAATPPTTTPQNPVSIIGTSGASDTLQNTMIPAMNTASAGLAAQNAKTQSMSLMDGSSYNANGQQITPPNGSQMPNSGNSGVNNGSSTQTPVPPEQTPGTPEHTLLNTPDAGNQFVYDPQGNRLEVPIGNIPAGMSTTPPPAPPTVSNQVTQSNGATIKQLSDGTYGSYDVNGNYQGEATAQQFQDAQTAQTLSQNIANLANGTMPLSASEQAQVTALQNSFASLITAQQTANANYTGGVTSAMNLYGMGTSVSGLGEISGSISAGLAKIADLNNKMAQAVSTMEQSFKDDDMANFKTAYDVLTGAQKDRQDAITAAKTAADAAAKAQVDYNLQLKTQQDTEARNTFDEQMANTQLSDSEKKDALDEALQKAQVTGTYTDPVTGKTVTTEQAKQDLIDNYYKSVTASHEATSLADQQATLTGIYTDPTTGKQSLTLDAQKLLGTNAAEISSALTQTVATNPTTGKPISFVDGTNLTPEAAAAATSAGQIVISKDNMPTMNSINNLQGGVAGLLATLQSDGVVNAQGQITGNKAGNWLTRTLDVGGGAGPEQAANNFNTTIKTEIASLEKQPGTGDLIQTLDDNLPGSKDSMQTLSRKITNIKNALNTSQTSILAQAAPPQPQTATVNGKTLTLQPDGTYQ